MSIDRLDYWIGRSAGGQVVEVPVSIEALEAVTLGMRE